MDKVCLWEGSGGNTMTHGDFFNAILAFARIKFGADHIEVVMTTKLPDYGVNKYTLYASKQKKLVAKSDEVEGYNKHQWSPQGYGELMATLKEVDNGTGTKE